jgi:hypothetical protein
MYDFGFSRMPVARCCSFLDGDRGQEYREKICGELLEMEPPTDFDQDLLK